MPALLKVSDLTVRYFSRSTIVTALDSVSVEIPAGGHTLGIVGESGSGKTTLGLSMLNVIEPPGKIVDGKVEFHGDNILGWSNENLRKYRWRGVSMVYQSAMNSLNPVKKVADHIVEVIRDHEETSKSEARERSIRLLKEVGIDPKFGEYFPHELSGGMKQRVVIALALALSPELLIADEPTSALDIVTQRRILHLIKRQAARKGLSLVFITHEIAVLAGLVENVAVMHRGEIVEYGRLSNVLFSPLHPYTEALLNTLLTMESSKEILARAEFRWHGAAEPGACKYSAACKYAFARCKVEAPKLREVEPGRWVSCHKF
jgi:peptide/nickel transport system ATP-binding protein